MDIKEITSDVLFKKYKIVIPKKTIDEAAENKAVEIAKTAQIPGFRVGKVPLKIVKERYRDNINSDLINEFVQSSVDKIVKENEFELAARPSIDAIDFKDAGELSFEAAFELLPKIPEIDFSKIKLTKYVAKVSEKEIDEAFKNLQDKNKELNSVGDGISIEEGHVVLLDATGEMGGKEFPEGKVTDYKLKIGSGAFIGGFEDGLIGARLGAEKTLKLKFPEDYHVEKYSGKDVTFFVKIKEIFKEDLPKLDDEFAKKFNLKSLVELREAVGKSAGEQFEIFSRTLLKKDLFDVLDKDVQIDLPTRMLNTELFFVNNTANQEKSEEEKTSSKQKKSGTAKAKIEKKKDYKHDHEAIAKRRIKLGLFINDLAKKEKISLTQQDISDEVMSQMKAYPEAASFLMKYYKENPQAVESLQGKILEDKAVSFILNKISTEEKNVTAEELKSLHSKTS
jgi:trigger factor